MAQSEKRPQRKTIWTCERLVETRDQRPKGFPGKETWRVFQGMHEKEHTINNSYMFMFSLAVHIVEVKATDFGQWWFLLN